VALLVLGVGCGRQTRVSAPNPAVATTVIPALGAPAPAPPVSTPAPAPAVVATGSDLRTADSVLADIDTQLATVDRDLATDEGDPTK
jgi:hypothetical protein